MNRTALVNQARKELEDAQKQAAIDAKAAERARGLARTTKSRLKQARKRAKLARKSAKKAKQKSKASSKALKRAQQALEQLEAQRRPPRPEGKASDSPKANRKRKPMAKAAPKSKPGVKVDKLPPGRVVGDAPRKGTATALRRSAAAPVKPRPNATSGAASVARKPKTSNPQPAKPPPIAGPEADVPPTSGEPPGIEPASEDEGATPSDESR